MCFLTLGTLIKWFSNPWYLDQVAQTVVTKTDVVKMQTTTLPKQKVVKRYKTQLFEKDRPEIFLKSYLTKSGDKIQKTTVSKPKVVKMSKTHQKKCKFVFSF